MFCTKGRRRQALTMCETCGFLYSIKEKIIPALRQSKYVQVLLLDINPYYS